MDSNRLTWIPHLQVPDQAIISLRTWMQQLPAAIEAPVALRWKGMAIGWSNCMPPCIYAATIDHFLYRPFWALAALFLLMGLSPPIRGLHSSTFPAQRKHFSRDTFGA